MKNIVLTGIGGQGTVLAAKVLAQAAQSKGWHVRTAETIGMAQRGGSVVSHVRMGDEGERVAAPLVSRGQADVLISFEPGEGARMCGVLKPEGALVTASRVVQPVTASLSKATYEANSVLRALVAREGSTVIVDECPILEEGRQCEVPQYDSARLGGCHGGAGSVSRRIEGCGTRLRETALRGNEHARHRCCVSKHALNVADCVFPTALPRCEEGRFVWVCLRGRKKSLFL
ncbi:MAG: 2-oxoacid:acceptor oxidoreductase family protein [Slackia sp.]